MFNKNYTISRLEEANELLQRENAQLKEMVNELKGYIENKPQDCKMGEYCSGCQLAKLLTVYSHAQQRHIIAFVCGKDGVCQNYKARSTG